MPAGSGRGVSLLVIASQGFRAAPVPVASHRWRPRL